jgi:hypothetical protein
MYMLVLLKDYFPTNLNFLTLYYHQTCDTQIENFNAFYFIANGCILNCLENEMVLVKSNNHSYECNSLQIIKFVLINGFVINCSYPDGK